MITKAQITRRSSDEGVSARAVERDYVLAHVVAAVEISNVVRNLVFTGGTALGMCHFKRVEREVARHLRRARMLQ